MTGRFGGNGLEIYDPLKDLFNNVVCEPRDRSGSCNQCDNNDCRTRNEQSAIHVHSPFSGCGKIAHLLGLNNWI